MSLESLREILGDCKECELYNTRTNIVYGYGSEEARIMFIGEAPGSHEDKQGYPFVGAAGKLLDQLLASIGLIREQVYIANVLKCRPPGNRNPLPEEIRACKGNLFAQINAIRPDIIVTLGNFATKLVLNVESGISKNHGKAYRIKDKLIFPIYHPAAGLYTGSVKEILFADFMKLGILLEGLQSKKNVNLPNNEDQSDTPNQTALW